MQLIVRVEAMASKSVAPLTKLRSLCLPGGLNLAFAMAPETSLFGTVDLPSE